MYPQTRINTGSIEGVDSHRFPNNGLTQLVKVHFLTATLKASNGTALQRACSFALSFMQDSGYIIPVEEHKIRGMCSLSGRLKPVLKRFSNIFPSILSPLER